MSYDLYFWRYEVEPGASFNHTVICDRLLEADLVEGVALLPAEEIRRVIEEEFAGSTKYGDVTYDTPDGGFQLDFMQRLLCIYCNGCSTDLLNKIIEIPLRFGCALFDPQLNERFPLPPEGASTLDEDGSAKRI